MTNDEAQVQIEGFNRQELRSACKAAGIQYSKLDAAGMRGALIALLPQEVLIDDGKETPEANSEGTPKGWDVAGGETDAPTPTEGLKIEKNRPEQNGIKRPSAGGKCRAVWDALDALAAETGTTVAGITSKQVKSLAAQHGFNTNNASIEFYQWRKYNGVTGRAAKQ